MSGLKMQMRLFTNQTSQQNQNQNNNQQEVNKNSNFFIISTRKQFKNGKFKSSKKFYSITTSRTKIL